MFLSRYVLESEELRFGVVLVFLCERDVCRLKWRIGVSSLFLGVGVFYYFLF